MKKPGESLYDYVTRRVAEEGPQTDEQAEAGFIDGNAGHEAEAVVFGLGKGKKQLKKPDKSGTDQPKRKLTQTNMPAEKPKLMPIIDRTAEDAGMGFIIGGGGGTPASNKGGGKTKTK